MVPNYSGSLVTIATIHFDRLLAFYSHLFGQEPNPLMPNVYAGFQLSGLNLGLFRPHDIREFPSGVGAMSLCLEVDDLEQAIAHATLADAILPSVIVTASHGRESYIYDPDGNRIILHQAKKVSEP